jgi:hypothetical protein
MKSLRARVLVQFEVPRASCPCEFMAKMAMPLQTEPVPGPGQNHRAALVRRLGIARSPGSAPARAAKRRAASRAIKASKPACTKAVFCRIPVSSRARSSTSPSIISVVLICTSMHKRDIPVKPCRVMGGSGVIWSGVPTNRRSIPRKRESNPQAAHLARFAGWIAALRQAQGKLFAGMTTAWSVLVSQMTPLPGWGVRAIAATRLPRR